MSNTETKRGLVAPQGGVSAIATSTPAWDAAVAALKAEKQHVLDHPAEDMRQSYHDAVDRVLGTPAPNGAALAYKVGLQSWTVVKHPDRTFDELLGAFTPEAIQNIIRDGEDDEKAALALYFDAMALAGVVASVAAPAVTVGSAWPKVWAEYLAADAASLAAALADEDDDDTTVSDRYLAARRAVLEHDAPNWAAVAAKLRALGDMIGCDPVEQPDPTSVRYGAGPEALTQVYLAYEQAAALGETNPGDCNPRTVALTLLATEGLAKIMAERGYAQFAISPEGLSEIALAVTAIQRDARGLSHEIAHGFAAGALDRVWRAEGDDEPNPPGAKPTAEPAPELTNAVASYRSAQARLATAIAATDEAHGTDRWDAALEAQRLVGEEIQAAFEACIEVAAFDRESMALKRALIIERSSDGLVDDIDWLVDALLGPDLIAAFSDAGAGERHGLSAQWRAIAARWEATYATYAAAVASVDEVAIGRAPTEGEQLHFKTAEDAHRQTWSAVCGYSAKNIPELAAKAGLLQHDSWDGAAEADSLTHDLARLAKAAGPSSQDAENWAKAAETHRTVKAAYDAAEGVADEAEVEAAHGAYCDALEAWETMSPPTIEALAEVMGASIMWGPLKWGFCEPDDPRSIRDLLDSDDADSIFVGRYYLHVLNLAGRPISTPPIQGLYPEQDVYTGDFAPGDVERHWVEYHATKQPRPERQAALAAWEAEHGPDASRLAAPEAEG